MYIELIIGIMNEVELLFLAPLLPLLYFYLPYNNLSITYHYGNHRELLYTSNIDFTKNTTYYSTNTLHLSIVNLGEYFFTYNLMIKLSNNRYKVNFAFVVSHRLRTVYINNLVIIIFATLVYYYI